MNNNKLYSYFLSAIVFLLGVAGAANGNAPFYDSSIGFLDPADTYAVDIVLDDQGNIYTIDPHHKRVRVEKPSGEIIQEFNSTFWLARGIARDSSGNVYVSDSSRKVIAKFNSAGVLEAEWKSSGGIAFSALRGIYVDHLDRLWVTDSDLNKVLVLNMDGTLDRAWGVSGNDGGQLNRPNDVTVTPSGDVYVVSHFGAKIQKFDEDGNLLLVIAKDSPFTQELTWFSSIVVNSSGEIFINDRKNSTIYRLDETGEVLNSWGGRGDGPGQFIHSHGMALGPDETLWVAGYHGHDIQQFSSAGQLLQRVQRSISSDDGNADVRGLALDALGNIFFSDGWNQRIKKYSLDGTLLAMWGERGEGDTPNFNFPKPVAVDSLGNVFVGDDDGFRKFSSQGDYLGLFGPHSLTTGSRYFVEPRGVVFDAADNLYVSDTLNARIVKLEAGTGNILLEWGSQGAGEGQFNYPRGLTFGPNGNLYIADSFNKRIQVYSPDGVFVRGWSTTAEVGNPRSVVMDQDNSILVGGSSAITRYSQAGDFIEQFGGAGSEPGQFDRIWKIAVGVDGTLYVSDGKNGRIQRLVYPFTSPTQNIPSYIWGGDLGYFLWQDIDDGEWHLRWSGDGVLHQFDMVITSVDGGFASVRPFSFEGRDALTQTANEIVATGYAGTWEDGLDFFTSPGAVLKFDLRIDGVADAARVFIGGAGTNPTTSPVYISAQLPGQEVFSISGAPSYRPGKTVGYYLWQDAVDGIWHLRWNSDGVSRDFTGSITSTGLFSSVIPINWEFNQDSYFVESFVLGFSGKASTWHDGIDFQVPDGATLLLNLSIDGVESPAQVFVGSGSGSPTALPFSLTSLPAVSAVDPLGKPAFVGAGELGYFVWVDASDVWHVRANPDGATHTFNGVITTEGAITSLIPVSVENNDILNQSGQTIDWNMSAASWYDGFDFTVQGDGRIMFDVSLDGVVANAQTFIGAARGNPVQSPFTLN